jgi:hypothetical protein
VVEVVAVLLPPVMAGAVAAGLLLQMMVVEVVERVLVG